MSRYNIDVRATSEAPPSAVFALLRDGRTWPDWGPFVSFELERPGEDGGESVGAIRVFHSRSWGRSTTSREQITELVPDRRLSYVLLSGLPLRNYEAHVDLEPHGRGTVVRWRSSFDAGIPGTGWLYHRALRSFLATTARAVAVAAAHAPA